MLRLKCTVVLLITLLTVLSKVKADSVETKKFQSCNPSNSTEQSSGCPIKSNCIENGTVNGTVQGFCVCESNNEVNQNFSSSDPKSQYCIEKKSESHPTESTVQTTPKATVSTSTSTTTVKPEVKTTAEPTVTTSSSTKKPEPEPEDKSDVKVSPAPQGHHIAGGILLPIFVVLGFIGAVFAIRKYDLIQRAHGFIRHRQQETRYNGLMENDFDDDPLLI